MVVEHKSFQQPAFADLVKTLGKNFNDLIFHHIELFKYELREDAILAARYTSIAIAGILVGYTGLIFFGLFMIFFFLWYCHYGCRLWLLPYCFLWPLPHHLFLQKICLKNSAMALNLLFMKQKKL